MKKKPMNLFTDWLHRFFEQSVDWIILIVIALIILLVLYLF
ncbi:hypothetical protein [Spirosoma sp. KCTC 42546]|nr:hypothetical protein [Spirosoma sp. KCTC 42546]